ncbi:hypothetical protein UWK_02719 [Desulfocapsa sulfexigens DSM 10523]|uniref:Uncharacterized protein n=1 Tax=Desulfocapsa sulfexigens (strain DSM 10523 / SB164P1) TaxID=1167006 RepID=M1PI29_DESSD|nr:hypothetical protein [Desulfocapsa sulfexigens]AGF79255.1 hypothetical protein UWK_02719 [Desulfocapsa sulfexigens DSM 10523]
MSFNLALVLQSIDNKSPIEKLFRHGIQYSQYFLLVNEALEKGFLNYDTHGQEEDLIVTDAGRIFIASAQKKSKGKEPWIIPLDSEKIDSIGIGEIYIPRLTTIRKLKV